MTLRELNQIKEAFVQILTGIFHGRIEYPDQDKKLGIAQSVKSDKIEKKVELQKIRKTTSIENGDSATKPVSSDSEPIQDKKESNDTDLYSSTPEKAKP